MGARKKMKGSRMVARETHISPAGSLREKIWRTSIGHYGGLYVSVPAEHIESFKKAFPKSLLPRQIKKVSVADQFTMFGEKEFHRRFPKSKGIVYEMHFGNRSKGIIHLEKMLVRPEKAESFVIDPFPSR